MTQDNMRRADSATGQSESADGQDGSDVAAGPAGAISPYVRGAREYWRKGWTNPLPISQKNYPPRGYTGINGSNVSWPDIMAWEEEPKHRNIAVRSQGSWVGVDVDAYDDKVGEKTLAEYEERLGKLPPTISSTSRGPGASRIYFFSIPPGTHVMPEGKMRDIEIVRREHRYAMVWPSVHPKTGETYQWYGHQMELLPEVPSLSDMAPWPQAWLDEFTQRKSSYTDGTVARVKGLGFGAPARVFSVDEANSERNKKLESIRTASKGQVNSMLGGAARWLYRFVPEFWERQDIDSAILAALADADRALGTSDPSTWGPNPWSPAQQLQTAWLRSQTDWHAEVRPGFTLAVSQPAAMPVAPATLARSPFGAPLSEPTEAQPVESPAPVASAASVPDVAESPIATDYGLLIWEPFFDTDLTDVEWLAGGLLQKGRQAALVGDAKSGKSLFALEWACAIASGKPFLNDGAREPRVVAYLDQENSRADIQSRLKALGYGAADLTNLRYLSFPPMGPLDTPQGAASFVAAIRAMGAEVVFLDTISRMIEGKENDSDPWLALYRYALMPLKSNGVSSVRLDHLGKSNTGARGSSAKAGDVDEIWELRLSQPGELVLEKTHTRTGIGVDQFRIKRTGRAGEIGTTKHLASVVAPQEDVNAPAPASESDALGVPGETFSRPFIAAVSTWHQTFGFQSAATKGEVKSVLTAKSPQGAGLSGAAFYRAWAKLESLRWIYAVGGKYYLRDEKDRALLRQEDIERGEIKPGGIVK